MIRAALALLVATIGVAVSAPTIAAAEPAMPTTPGGFVTILNHPVLSWTLPAGATLEYLRVSTSATVDGDGRLVGPGLSIVTPTELDPLCWVGDDEYCDEESVVTIPPTDTSSWDPRRNIQFPGAHFWQVETSSIGDAGQVVREFSRPRRFVVRRNFQKPRLPNRLSGTDDGSVVSLELPFSIATNTRFTPVTLVARHAGKVACKRTHLLRKVDAYPTTSYTAYCDFGRALRGRTVSYRLTIGSKASTGFAWIANGEFTLPT
ncbi:MAG: hypothetical protein JWM98_1810 [Thermoleophilia bacterium]|nr:hypothetical protein [Thermoleophilia bacterium]